MTTPMNKNIRSHRSFALMLAVASTATGITLAGVGVAMPGAVRAAKPMVLPSEQVHYRDLDLATEAGASKLQHRIRRAARRVCSDVGNPLIIRGGACVKETTRNGLAAANQKIAQHRAPRLATD